MPLTEDIIVSIVLDSTKFDEQISSVQDATQSKMESIKGAVTGKLSAIRKNLSDLVEPFDQWKDRMSSIEKAAAMRSNLEAYLSILSEFDVSNVAESKEALAEALARLKYAYQGVNEIAPSVIKSFRQETLQSKEKIKLDSILGENIDKLAGSYIGCKESVEAVAGIYNKFTGVLEQTVENMPAAADEAMSLADKFRMAVHGTRRFRMELLSVMFFGMALQRIFYGLLNPTLSVLGVFELFTAALTVFFLPIGLVLLDFLMPLIEWMINADDTTKLVVGGFIVFGLVVGSLLALIGMFGLGISGVILAFGFLKSVLIGIAAVAGVVLPTALGGTGVALSSVGAAATGAATAGTAASTGIMASMSGVVAAISSAVPIILIVIAAIIALWFMWQTNFANIREFTAGVFSAISDIISGVIDFIYGVVDFFLGIMTLDVDKTLNGLQKMVESFGKILIFGIARIIWEILKFISNAIIQIISWVVRFPFFILEIMKRIGSIIWDGIKFILVKVLGVPEEIIQAFENLPKYFFDLVNNLINSIWEGLKRLPGLIINAIRQIPVIGNVVADAMEAAGRVAGGIVDTIGKVGKGIYDTVSGAIGAVDNFFKAHDKQKKQASDTAKTIADKNANISRSTTFSYNRASMAMDDFNSSFNEMSYQYNLGLGNMGFQTDTTLGNMGMDWNNYLANVKTSQDNVSLNTSAMMSNISEAVNAKREIVMNAVTAGIAMPFVGASDTMVNATSIGIAGVSSVVTESKPGLEKALKVGLVDPFRNAANAVLSTLQSLISAYASVMDAIGVSVKVPKITGIAPAATAIAEAPKAAAKAAETISARELFVKKEPSLIEKLTYAGPTVPAGATVPYIPMQKATTNYFVNMDVHANVSKDYDVHRLADMLEKEMSMRLYRR